MKAILLKITATLLAITLPVLGQPKTWQMQTSCDGFSVELPSPLYKVSWFEGKHGAEIEPDGEFNSGKSCYAALQENPKHRQFGIVVFDERGESTAREREGYKKGIFGAWHFMIGGDDDEATSEKIVRVNGLLGREYVFAKAIQLDTYTRGRIFYVNGRLYFIILVTSSAEDLMSPDADRFLNSFHIVSRRAAPKRKAH
jgi:hypothetical protein